MAQQVQFVYLTQAEYDALGAKDAARLYFTSDTKRVYRGSQTYIPQRIFYGTCSTNANTAIKTVTCGDFTDQDLTTGTVLIVKFTYDNKTINLKLKVNDGTAKNMKWQDGVDVCNNPWAAGQTVQFVYDGAQWIMMETTLAILTYGSSTWNDFLNAYNRNALVYCQVTVSGGGSRMAFMAYNIISGSNANVEFQYVRSLSTKTITDQGDETIIYKLDSSGTWTTTTRKNYTRIAAGTGLGGQFSGGTTTPVLTLRNTGVLSVNGSTGDVTISDASTSTKGLVQLNDTLTSTSTTQAATTNAVKQLNDKFDDYVSIADLEDGLQVDDIEAKSITIDGVKPSLEGHTHSEYKVLQTAKSSPTASGTDISFIDTVSQDANGEITATRKSVRSASTSQTGVVQLSSATNSTSEALAATPKAVKTAYDLASSKSSVTIIDWEEN